MIGDAGHAAMRVPFAYRAGGQHDVEFAGGDFSIFVKGFVEIPQAKEENGIGILAFDVKILLANGGDVIFCGHGLILLRVARLFIDVTYLCCCPATWGGVAARGSNLRYNY